MTDIRTSARAEVDNFMVKLLGFARDDTFPATARDEVYTR